MTIRNAALGAIAVLLGGAAALPADDGDLDPTFGSSGRVSRSLQGGNVGGDLGTAVSIDAQGRVLVVGRSGISDFDGSSIGLARWLANGDPDTAFGSGGAALRATPGASGHEVRDISLDSSGRILVAGARHFSFTAGSLVARFLDDGSWDPSFFGTGWVDIDFGVAGAVAEDPATGVVWALATDQSVYLWRWDPAGGAPVIVTPAIPGYASSFGVALAIQPDHKLLFAGWGYGIGGSSDDVFVGRLMPDGGLDSGFGDGGFRLVGFDLGPTLSLQDDRLIDMALDSQGRIVLAAEADDAEPSTGSDLGVARLLPDGTLDPSFGNGGTTTIGIDLDADRRDALDSAGGIALQGDGRILIAVSAGVDPGGNTDARAALVRLLPDGSPDPQFGGGDGRLDLDLLPDGGAEGSGFRDVALDSSGRIVGAGWGRVADPDLDFSLARFENSYIFADGFGSGDVSAWSEVFP